MRTTINIDDDLLSKAAVLSGTTEKTRLVHQALEALVARESARRLARLGGIAPDMDSTPRRRSAPKTRK